MCFGNATTDTKTSTATPNPAVASAATQALSSAQALQNQGYTPYSGQRVADFSQLQQSGFGDAANAVNSQNPYTNESAGLIQQYGTAGPQSVNASPISSAMSPYMNQYVQQALAPQLEAQNQQFAAQNRNLNAQATSSGAFGDSRAGIEAANLTNQQNIGRTGLIGQAYSNAFNTAIGAGAQDVANNMQAQSQTGGFNEQALQRALGGGNALQGLYSTNLSQLANQYGLSAQAGGQQQQQEQAKLNVPYSNYLAGQQYPFLTAQNLYGAVNAGAHAMPASTTTTDMKPDNSGWALAGSLGGAALGSFVGMPGLGASLGGAMGGYFGGGPSGDIGYGTGVGSTGPIPSSSGWGSIGTLSDERAKEDIEKIGQLRDGQNVYRFRYKGDKTPQIGLIAQEVEKLDPGAVVEFRGRKYVNYDRATSLAAAMGEAA